MINRLLTVIAVSSLLPFSLVAGTLQPHVDTVTEGVLRVTVTYTEEATINAPTQKPKDVDDTEFTFRANATYERRVKMHTEAGSGMSVDSCMVWNPDGGCKTYFPLSYGGSIDYKTTHKVHTENPPNELPDVYDVNSQSEFSGVLIPDSEVEVAEDNFNAIQVRLVAGMKGSCQLQRTHKWVTQEFTNPPTRKNHTDEKTVKSCTDSDWEAIPYGPDGFSGIMADKSSDKPETRELKFTVYACNNNPEYCADLKKTDAGVTMDRVETGWIGGNSSGTPKQGYNFEFAMPKDVSKNYIPSDAKGSWKQQLTVSAKITPGNKVPAGHTALMENQTEVYQDTTALVTSDPEEMAKS